MLGNVKERALAGIPATIEEALELNERYSADELADAADEVRRKWCGDVIDTCSIVNARSGRCTEDCKWCAQSRCHHTGIDEYDFVGEEEALRAARLNCEAGIKRYSFVTSGRKVAPGDIDKFCEVYRKVGESTGLYM
ncbi:MAG: biotin synthase BioB, partial [Muribaculum sp.]|nr:biotin synthase BioB [Muribaculum sp.]